MIKIYLFTFYIQLIKFIIIILFLTLSREKVINIYKKKFIILLSFTFLLINLFNYFPIIKVIFYYKIYKMFEKKYNETNYDNVNTIMLTPYKNKTTPTYLFFDIFARNQELILICPKYYNKFFDKNSTNKELLKKKNLLR